ncbi:TOPRIM nucleotidyl transferase/hydrolase domain-containing protein [Leptospira kanakyensis]|uniref:OLD protein-like TOPRIM domain-containing protein n=1 Tax=Leptospira kanakyensis TaxID=2484968 RepID=A0A6N4QE53_9LEPT|nr:TOPRIM nucleotidyl transferase/hydrolase domain-containing protein [Leptospira kanakyensis]TGK45969.1 hypothetical protein EHQ11_19675 [Leptospira kanakyensis]TGK70609.1 hypothetical protein EHQ18_09165 [Leptospira kanakyensis]
MSKPNDLLKYFPDTEYGGPDVFALYLMEKASKMNFFNLIDDILYNHAVDPTILDKLNDKELFIVFRQYTNTNLELLYDKFLPELKSHFVPDTNLEEVPFLTMFYNEVFSTKANEYLKKRILARYKITDIEPEKLSEAQIKEITGIDIGDIKYIPVSLQPKSDFERAAFVYWLYNIPPLKNFHDFFLNYHSHTDEKFKIIHRVFNGEHNLQLPKFYEPPILHFSGFFIPIQYSRKIDLESIKQKYSATHKDAIARIEKQILLNKGRKSKTGMICSHCGGVHDYITIPEDIVILRALLAEDALARQYSFDNYEDITDSIKKETFQKFEEKFENLNSVEYPGAIILVEGESEEAALPLLSIRLGHDLSFHNIRIENSKSKQKLLQEFHKHKIYSHTIPIIILLDNDAKKEAEEINRIIKDKKNKYRLFLIPNGTFEDLYPLSDSIKLINELYEGEKIKEEDWDSKKDFLTNVDKLLWQKKKAKFDKVKFAKLLSVKIELDNIPKLITELINTAILLKEKNTPIKF